MIRRALSTPCSGTRDAWRLFRRNVTSYCSCAGEGFPNLGEAMRANHEPVMLYYRDLAGDRVMLVTDGLILWAALNVMTG